MDNFFYMYSFVYFLCHHSKIFQVMWQISSRRSYSTFGVYYLFIFTDSFVIFCICFWSRTGPVLVPAPAPGSRTLIKLSSDLFVSDDDEVFYSSSSSSSSSSQPWAVKWVCRPLWSDDLPAGFSWVVIRSMMAVMTAQSLDFRFSQSTGDGVWILSCSRESSSFFRFCRKQNQTEKKKGEK